MREGLIVDIRSISDRGIDLVRVQVMVFVVSVTRPRILRGESNGYC